MITLEEIYELLEQAERNKKAKAEERRLQGKAARERRIAAQGRVRAVGWGSDEVKPTGEDVEAFDEEEDDGTDVERADVEAISEYVLPKINLLETKAKGGQAKRREQFAKILTFIEINRHRRSETGCFAMPIPTTAKAYLQIWGSTDNVKNARIKMRDIGLIELHRPYDHPNHRSAVYRYYQDNVDEFVAYCEKQGIKRWIPKSWDVKELTSVEKKAMPFNSKGVIFSYNLRLVKPEGMSRSEFIERWIMPALYENYPWFKLWREKIRDEMNAILEKTDRDLCLFFEPSFTWTTVKYKTGKKETYIRKIGIRLSNRLVGLSSEGDSDSERQRYRDRMGLRLDKDVRSSIPRITKSLYNLGWVDESVDIYSLINDRLEPKVEFTPYRRNVIKELHMRVYFNEWSDADIAAKIMKSLRDGGIDTKKISKDDVAETMGKLRVAMIEAEGGEPFGNEVFYVESMVYLLTIYDLLTAGRPVYFVFDCFYCTGDEPLNEFRENVSSLIKANFEYFMMDFLGIKKKPQNSGRGVKEVLERFLAGESVS